MMRRPSPAIVGMMLIGLAGFATRAGTEAVAQPRAAPFTEARMSAPAGQPAAPVFGLRGLTVMAATQAPPPSAPAREAGALIPPAPVGTARPAPDLVAPTAKPPAMAIAEPGGTIAFDAGQRSLVDRANTYLTGVQTMVGDFVQVGPDGGRSEGKFFLQKPGRIRFEYDPPNQVELISDGSSMVVRDNKLNTQDLYPLSQTPLRFLLADRIDLLKDTNLIGVYADELFVTLVIEERQVFAGTHRLLLMFGAQDFQLRQWTVTDPQGLDTTVAIYNLDINNKRQLNPELFKINYQRMLP